MRRMKFRFKGVLAYMARRNKKSLKRTLSMLGVALYNMGVGETHKQRMAFVTEHLNDLVHLAMQMEVDEIDREVKNREFIRQFKLERAAYLAAYKEKNNGREEGCEEAPCADGEAGGV
jgi:hypothetical protein